MSDTVPVPETPGPGAAAASPRGVVVMGGGLAGMTLALQLRGACPDLPISVLERNRFPVPEAAHKVGESTVEIGANYLADVIGAREHLRTRHLKKFGFRFFFSEGRRDIDGVAEIGASRPLDTDSFQIDRGVFENHLAERAAAEGIELLEGARVTGVELGDGREVPHQVRWRDADGEHRREARWVVDASGRAGLLRRKLGLDRDNGHGPHAVWFRVKGHVRVDDWTDNPSWQQRCDPRTRWLSTNHLVGKGYWVWMIPLSSDHHSIGIVADPRIHPLERMKSFDAAMAWLAENQPALFDALDARRDALVDFAYFRRFSYGCEQVFSSDRWALTGEAGLFLDPFYSPGTDFIAISNTYITDLIGRDLAGERFAAHAHVFDQLYHSFYESTMTLYVDQYEIFGDPEVLPNKVIWDYAYYWGVLSQFFFQRRLTDLSALSQLRVELAHCQALNREMQAFLRAWSRVSERRNDAVMHDQASLDWFAALNGSLEGEALDDAAFRARIRAVTERLSGLALRMMQIACAQYPGLGASALAAVIDATPGVARGALPGDWSVARPVAPARA